MEQLKKKLPYLIKYFKVNKDLINQRNGTYGADTEYRIGAGTGCCFGAHLAHLLTNSKDYLAGRDAWTKLTGGNAIQAMLLLREAGAGHDPFSSRPWKMSPEIVLENLREIEHLREILRGLDLRGVDLKGADLRYLDLRYCDLREATLRDADLKYADLERVDLRKADLYSTSLCNADLRCANLDSADLGHADLRRADLFRADLKYSYLRYTNLINTNLKKANLRGAVLTKAKLKNTDFEGADLTDADFRNAYVQSINVRGAVLYGTILDEVVIIMEKSKHLMKKIGGQVITVIVLAYCYYMYVLPFLSGWFSIFIISTLICSVFGGLLYLTMKDIELFRQNREIEGLVIKIGG